MINLLLKRHLMFFIPVESMLMTVVYCCCFNIVIDGWFCCRNTTDDGPQSTGERRIVKSYRWYHNINHSNNIRSISTVEEWIMFTRCKSLKIDYRREIRMNLLRKYWNGKWKSIPFWDRILSNNSQTYRSGMRSRVTTDHICHVFICVTILTSK